MRNIYMNQPCKISRGTRTLSLLLSGSAICISTLAGDTDFSLKNRHIQAAFAGGLPTVLERADGRDPLIIDDDGFEILLFDKSRFTADDFDIQRVEKTSQTAVITYSRKDGTSAKAPAAIRVSYELAEGPYLFKDVEFGLAEGETIDRLQVLRFSSETAASHGGMGQPVYLGNWFCGINYPHFYSRHNSNFKEPEFSYTYSYTVDPEIGAEEQAPRNGLVTLFHFPGYAKQQENGTWGIRSKRAVIGISATPGENAELALLDYIDTYRKPTRSYTHFNNWYTGEAKHLTVESFSAIARELKDNLGKYGASFDAMVPDNGWQNKGDFKTIYEPSTKHDPLPEISKALRAMDVDFGIWIAIDGTTYKGEAGVKAGYRMADPDLYKHTAGRWGTKDYFDILDPKYQADYKKNIGTLMTEADIRYIKHDFNHMFVADHLSERHAREACLDATLELIDFERKLSPKVLINYTNGSFFSPFYLLFFEYLWMNSGDSGSSGGWPQLGGLENATTYRDNHFFKSFNNPDACPRPVIPIANFMTHGILHSGSKVYFNEHNDPISDWINYCMMYYGRGTLLKELYISPKQMTEAMWKGLGTSTAWAQVNEARLKNTVIIGGDSNKGEVYGFISWNGDEGILSIRNPSREQQTLTVPFDRTVYYRGAYNKAFHARAIYPFVEQMPWSLTAGNSFNIDVPGDTVMVFELDAGEPLATTIATPAALPPFKTKSNDTGADFQLTIPDETFKRYDLLLTDYHNESTSYTDKRGKKRGKTIYPEAQVLIDGSPVEISRSLNGDGWAMSSVDLRPYRGKTIQATVRYSPTEGISKTETAIDAWLAVDRKVDAPEPAIAADEVLPWAVSQDYRHLSQQLLKKQTIQLTK